MMKYNQQEIIIVVEIQKYGYLRQEKCPTSTQYANSHANDLSGGGW